MWDLILSAKKVCLHILRSFCKLLEKEVKTLMLKPKQRSLGGKRKTSFKPESSESPLRVTATDGGPLRRVPKSWTLATMAETTLPSP